MKMVGGSSTILAASFRPSIFVRSRESSFRITFLDQTISLRSNMATDGRARLSVSACPGESNG